jgi:hypothetical protein
LTRIVTQNGGSNVIVTFQIRGVSRVIYHAFEKIAVTQSWSNASRVLYCFLWKDLLRLIFHGNDFCVVTMFDEWQCFGSCPCLKVVRRQYVWTTRKSGSRSTNVFTGRGWFHHCLWQDCHTTIIKISFAEQHSSKSMAFLSMLMGGGKFIFIGYCTMSTYPHFHHSQLPFGGHFHSPP